MLVGVAVLVVLLLLLLFSRLAARRRRREAEDLASEAAELPEPAVAAVAGNAAGLAPLLVDEPPVALTPFAAPEPESIDVNIFEVEFSNGLTMRVGYNHFPEGTELRWRVNQNQVEAARGSFVTKGRREHEPRRDRHARREARRPRATARRRRRAVRLGGQRRPVRLLRSPRPQLLKRPQLPGCRDRRVKRCVTLDTFVPFVRY